MKTPKLPKGWRLLKPYEIIEKGDMMPNNNEWCPTVLSKQDEYTPAMQKFDYIRRIARTRNGKK